MSLDFLRRFCFPSVYLAYFTTYRILKSQLFLLYSCNIALAYLILLLLLLFYLTLLPICFVLLTSVSHKKQHRPQRHLPLFLSLVNAWLLHSHKCVSETLSNWIIVKKTGTQYYVYFVIITPLNAFYHFYVNLMVLFFLFIFRWKKDFSVLLIYDWLVILLLEIKVYNFVLKTFN